MNIKPVWCSAILKRFGIIILCGEAPLWHRIDENWASGIFAVSLMERRSIIYDTVFRREHKQN